jgi:two-component system phosphoglycerate transport system response regulator PgtA
MKANHNTSHNSGGPLAYDRQQTVLLVDNDDANLKYMSEVLRQSGYGVAVFYDAPSALYFAMRDVRKFNLVLADYCLPGINGLELVEALKRLQPHVPMFLLADHIDICSKAFKTGIFECINKPINKLKLLGVVQEALGNCMPERVPAVRASLMEHVEQCQNMMD